eukprot:jgi/Picre1/31180/NNA_006534.t1
MMKTYQHRFQNAVGKGLGGAAQHRRGHFVIRSMSRDTEPGDRLGPIVTSSPLDFLSFGPRVAVGVLLSTGEALQKIPQDVERVNKILSDEAMPMEGKQKEILMEVEDRILEFVEKGVGVENGVIETLTNSIPQELQGSLPEPLRELLLTPRQVARGSSDDAVTSNRNKPLATWTITTSVDEDVYSNGNGVVMEEEEEEEFEMTPVTAARTAQGQAAAELVDIEMSVSSLRTSIEALKSNTDESKTGMLKLNVREAGQSLSQRIEQRAISSRSAGNPDIDAAISEAKELLNEVNTLL